jgi:hypothetical protein
MRGNKTGFRELGSDRDHAASTASKGNKGLGMTNRESTDMEDNRQDVDGTSDMGSIDPVIHREDPK